MRYFIKLSYNGSNYHGWQIQPNAITVQEVLQDALSTLLKSRTEILGAGRTDTGVHASCMFVHLDCDEINNTDALIYKLNSFLPKDIAIQEILKVKDDAHARFDATSRTYEYHIHQTKNVFNTNLSYYFKPELDINLMNDASKVLLNYEDFECFSRTNSDVKTFICNITEAKWERKGNGLIFTIKADRFLRNMVRAIVGTLLDIGQKKISVEHLHEIIKSKDRSNAGASAPAHGLYLTAISYPKEVFKQ